FYYVQAQTDPGGSATKFELIATGCYLEQAPANGDWVSGQCPTNSRAASRIKALITWVNTASSTSSSTTTVGTTTVTTTTYRPAFAWGMFGGTSINFSGAPATGVAIDSYDSRGCSPAPCAYTTTNSKLTGTNFGSNGSIDIGSGASGIYGNII